MKPEPLLTSLELKRSPELCFESSSSKANISSVTEKKLLDVELRREKLGKALKLQGWTTRPLCPDDYNIEEPKLPNLYKEAGSETLRDLFYRALSLGYVRYRVVFSLPLRSPPLL